MFDTPWVQRGVVLSITVALLLATFLGGAVVPVNAHEAHETTNGTTDDPEFLTETVLTGINQPLGITFLPDGRALVLEKPGRILIADLNTGNSQVYLDISDEVRSNGERGVLSLVLDPDFQQNGYFYLYYTRYTGNWNQIARFTHDENSGGLTSRADEASETLIWEDNERTVQTCCHFGGGLDIGPDGMIYLTTGEEFDGAQAQDLSQSGGKIIRINRDGSVPSTNPFAADGNPDTLDTIYAYGLRNPWSAQFDQETGRLFIAEVGGNSNTDDPDTTSYEDINVGKKGANYGWPDCEGLCDNPAYEDPIFTYPHTASTGGSVTMGPVYRGSQFPSGFEGVLFYGDYVRGWIKYLTFDSNGAVTGSHDFHASAGSVVAIEEGPDDSLYYADIVSGSITRISYQGGSAPTIIDASANTTSGPTPLTVEFSGSASDPDGDPLTYTWVFGDGESASGQTVVHTYDQSGSYTARLRVSDGTTTVSSDPIDISGGGVPDVSITAPANDSLFRGGDIISFEGSATDPEDGALSGTDLEWTVEFAHNEHTHPTLSGLTGSSGEFEIDTRGHDYHGDTSYFITLEATDSSGLSSTDSVFIRPDKVDVTFDTDPQGLTIVQDGLPRTGPFVYDTLIDFEHQLDAPSAQCVDGTNYEFVDWSDGGAQTHYYTVPATDATVTANYQAVGACSASIPTDGLALHLEATQGVSTSDSSVTGWTDLSGLGNDLTAVGEPTLVSGGTPAGTAAVSFDGSDDALRRTTTLNGLPTGSADRSVFVVARYDSTGFGGFTYGSPSWNDAFGLGVTNGGELLLQGWSGPNDFDSGVTGTGAGWLTQSVVLSNDNFVHYKDGSQIDSGTHTFTTSDSRLYLGSELTPPPYLDMEVAAVLVYDRALTETERQQVESHLQQTYLSASGETASVGITSPVEGETITGSELTVTWDATAATTGDHVHLTLDDQPSVGSLPLSGSYTFTGVAAGGHTVTTQVATSDHVLYTNPEATDSVSVTVETGTEDVPPVAADDTASVSQGGSVSVDVLSNDNDANGDIDPTAVQVVQYPASGTVVVDATTGAIEYTHDGSASTSDSFRYTVDDEAGATSNEATVSIDMTTGSSDSPVTNGLVLDLQAANGVSTSGSSVTGWTDLSGFGNDLSAVGAPTLVSGGTPAGTASVSFDGSDDALRRTTTLNGLPTGSADRSVFVVARYDSTGFGGFTYGSPSWNDAFGLGVTNGGELLLQGWSGPNDFDSGVTGTGAGWLTQSVVLSNDNFVHYKDGSQIDSGTHTFTTSDSRLYLGSELTPPPYLDMEVAAVLVYDRALTETERQQVETYLQQTYLDTSVNQAPTATDDSATVSSGGSVTVGVLANDADSDGTLDPSSVTVTNGPSSGTVSVDTGTGAIEYTHDGSASTGDSFRYTVADDAGALSNEATVSVDVTSTTGSDVPVSNGLVLDVQAGNGVSTSGSSVTGWADQSGRGNDLSAVGAPTFVSGGTPAGTAAVSFDGSDDALRRTTTLNGLPTGSSDRTMFVVTRYDSTGFGGFAYGSPSWNDAFGLGVTNGGELLVQGWGGGNDFDSGVIGTGTGWLTQSVVLSNDNFVHYRDGSQIDSGTHTFTTSDSRLYLGSELTPPPYLDMDVAAVLVYDRALTETERQQVETYLQQTYLGTSANQAPTATDDSASVSSGGSVTVDVLANDADSDGTLDPSSVTVTSGPSSGTVSVGTGTGAIEYTHDGSASTGDSFRYTVTDDAGALSNEATVSVSVTSTTNDPPTASDDTSSVSSGESVRVNVLANDADPDGSIDPTAVQVVQYPASGTVVVDATTGEIEYTHDGSASTSDSFRYTVADDAGALSNEATVSVDVTSTTGSDVPVSNGLVLDVQAGNGVGTSGSSVTGWTDQSGRGNDLTAVGAPTLVSGGTPAGTAAVSFDGSDDALRRTATLNGLPTGSADRSVFVVARYDSTGFGGFTYGSPSWNDAFGLGVTNGGELLVQGWGGGNDYDSGVAGTGTGWLTQSVVLSNDNFVHYKDGSQIDSGTHTFTTSDNRLYLGSELTPPPYLDMEVAAVLVYDRALTETERQQVETYLQQTYLGTSANQAPTATDDSATVSSGGSVTVDVLANDADSDGTLDPSSVTVTGSPSSGTVSVDTGTGAIEYTHDGSASTSDSFTYTVDDEAGATSNEATVSVDVTSTAGSDVPVTNGLVLDVQVGNGVSTSGSSVTGWTDQSGLGNDLSAVGAPTLVSGGTPAGTAAVSFDGSDDALRRTTTLNGLPTGSSDRTMFVVARYDSTGFGGFTYGSPSWNDAFGLGVTNGGELLVQGWSGPNDFDSGVAGTGTGWLTQSVVLSNDNFVHYKDGSQIDSGTHTFTTSDNRLYLGSELTPPPYLDMEVAAVLVYDRALTETERQQVETYLQQTYLGTS